MKITTTRLSLTKIVPLRISRGVILGSVNSASSQWNMRELSAGAKSRPNSVSGDTTESAEADFARWSDALTDISPDEMQRD